MAGADNLKGKGFDANPQNINRKGRPVVSDIKRFIKERLADTIRDPKGTETADQVATKLEAIIEKLLFMAGQGNLKALELILKYGYGNPTQAVEVSGPNGQSLITHDFSKMSNEQLAQHIEHLGSLLADKSQETTESGTEQA